MDKIKNLYIIDDDEIMVYLNQNLMKQHGFCEHSEVFSNGQAAIKHIRHIMDMHGELPDVMLVDLSMPVMDGWEFLDELVRVLGDRSIPVFIHTSSTNPSDKERLALYSFVIGYVQKPLTIMKLNKIMRLIA